MNNASYMDSVIPSDVILNSSTIINDLEKFYILNEKSKKWKKIDNYGSSIDILTEEEKGVCFPSKIENYYFELLGYYNFYKNKKYEIKRLSDKEEKLLSPEEHSMYLKELRLVDDKNILATMSMSSRLKFNPMLQKAMKLSRIASGIKVVKMNVDLPEQINNRPVIFVLTHVGKDDIIIFNEAIKQHYTILSGDYESLHNNAEGFITMLNGTLFFDMNSKVERKSVVDRVASVLDNKDNILCSMEGAWNISPNELVGDLFPGMIEAAYKANAVIVPVGIERFNEKFYGINVSKELIDPNKYLVNNNLMVDNALKDLRNMMASAKYELYFDDRIKDLISVSRSSIGDFDEYNQKYKDDILKSWTFNEKIIESKKYRNKDKPSYVFSYVVKKYYNYLKKINELCLNNTFECDNEFNIIYAQLLNDINNTVYPTNIHLELLNIYNSINNLVINNSGLLHKKSLSK